LYDRAGTELGGWPVRLLVPTAALCAARRPFAATGTAVPGRLHASPVVIRACTARRKPAEADAPILNAPWDNSNSLSRSPAGTHGGSVVTRAADFNGAARVSAELRAFPVAALVRRASS